MGLFIIALCAKKPGWYIACIVANVVSFLWQFIILASNPYLEFNPVGFVFGLVYITVCAIKLNKINKKENKEDK